MNKINVLMPEPISLVDDEAEVHDLNRNFSLQRCQVSDCTIVNGENGTKFAVWKVTLLLHPSACHSQLYYPRVETYRRYSDFCKFREQLIARCIGAHRPNIDVPMLPSRVKWYETWHYQEINLDRNWLSKRRQGLEFFLNHVLLNDELVELARDLVVKFLEPPQDGP
ncbi:YPT35 (YHR105W) [Zygosaccharomyces parabailii]|nr:YPT35 (YHR105W) [Zygosaccharomyces parabailii]CDH10070.1 related to PX domain-containing protein YPT35 [Zygosaccharomyces bailii ISA1307]